MINRSRLARSFGLDTATPSDNGPELIDEDETVQQSFTDVTLLLGDRQDQGSGSLHITTRRVVWFDDSDPSTGFAAHFSNICLHAISQANETHSKPCIYMQLEPGASEPEKQEDEEERGDQVGDGNEDNSEGSAELRLIPADSTSLQDIFQTLCACAAINPDPGQEGDEEDGDFFYDEDEVLDGAGVDRAAVLEHLDSLLQMPRADELDELLAEDPERFNDAEEDGGESNGVAPKQ